MIKRLKPRNPGPSWGYRCIRACDRHLPEPLFYSLRVLGSAVAMALMHRERRHSRDYLTVVLGRRAGFVEVLRHFKAFTEFLVLRLRVADGRLQTARFAPGSDDFRAFMAESYPALLGSMHLGHSDLIGFLFSGKTEHRVFMVREQRDNAEDLERLLTRYQQWVSIIWVNQSENLLFALKDAVLSGGSLAMKCDRVGYSAKTESFHFLGARRSFPFTIYHLAIIFERPVLLAIGMPGAEGESVVYSSPCWRSQPALSRTENLDSARTHFQDFLRQVEIVLREQPYQWFNFIPLNPVVAA